MIGIPDFGQRVRVWPTPGRAVQHGPRPTDPQSGGRHLHGRGEEVVWSAFHIEQLRAGDIMLHAPHESEMPEEEEKEEAIVPDFKPETPTRVMPSDKLADLKNEIR